MRVKPPRASDETDDAVLRVIIGDGWVQCEFEAPPGYEDSSYGVAFTAPPGGDVRVLVERAGPQFPV